MRMLLTPTYGSSNGIELGRPSSLHEPEEQLEVKKFAVSADVETTMQLAYLLIERGDYTVEDLEREIELRSFDPSI